MAIKRDTAAQKRHREIVKARGDRCAICGLPIDYSLPRTHPMSFELDHKVPLALGGADTLDNKQAVHKHENRSKSFLPSKSTMKRSATLAR